MAAEGGKSKKKGRKLDWCKSYRTRGQREINKAVKLIKTVDRNPNDLWASLALKKLPAAAFKAALKIVVDSGYVGGKSFAKLVTKGL